MRFPQVRSRCLDTFAAHYGGAVPLTSRPLSEQPGAAWLRLSPLTDSLYALATGHI